MTGTYVPRRERFEALFPGEPAFRWKQIEKALFNAASKDWSAVTTLPAAMKQALAAQGSWVSYSDVRMQTNSRRDTFKAALAIAGGKEIETVLMANARGQWTICVSSQVGCAMRCAFCATGKMGFMRNLHADEIIDQYRFWNFYMAEHPDLGGRISNVVYMGMGEPLANYENVKASLNLFLSETDLGKTRITVSTVGHLPRLDDILTDKDWPHVRLAVSIHSADAATRKQIVPTSYDQFLVRLSDWSIRYLAKLGNRRHHLTYEYVMLAGVNDTPMHAEKLAAYVRAIGQVKVNLIPYNFTGIEFERSSDGSIDQFIRILEGRGVTATKRRTMGDDIAAACGQLITEGLQTPKASATVAS